METQNIFFKILSNLFVHHYANTFEKSDKMDNFLLKYGLSKYSLYPWKFLDGISSGQDSVLSLPRALFQSLVRVKELRLCNLCGMAKKKKLILVEVKSLNRLMFILKSRELYQITIHKNASDSVSNGNAITSSNTDSPNTLFQRQEKVQILFMN